jgi:hypothetical protein
MSSIPLIMALDQRAGLHGLPRYENRRDRLIATFLTTMVPDRQNFDCAGIGSAFVGWQWAGDTGFPVPVNLCYRLILNKIMPSTSPGIIMKSRNTAGRH